MEKKDYLYIKNQSDLQQVIKALEQEKKIGVDLEADSLYHYQGKVCLFQLSIPSQNIIIDPLATDGLSALKGIFENQSIVKVFHGADYDIRSLYRDFKIVVNPLFDTQIAAKFLGIKEVGLASLLYEKMGVELKKKYQKKDWSKRPLPEDMLRYAVKDTFYLLPLADDLERELKKQGRFSWVMEECDALRMVRPSPPNHGPLFTKFKGAAALEPRELAVLEGILKLRERVAKRRDLPPFKILGNMQIMGMVETTPENNSDLGKIKGMSPKLIKSLGRALLESTKEAVSMPEEELPSYPRKRRRPVPRSVTLRIRALKTWREQVASSLDLEPSLICTNTQIQSIAASNPGEMTELEGVEGIREWQREVFGNEICSILMNL